MTSFARVLLVATSLAPLLLVAGCGWLVSAPERAWPALGTALALTLLCLGLLARVQHTVGFETIEIEKVSRADKNVLAFMLTYVLPLITPAGLSAAAHKTENLYALGAFLLLMAVVLYRAQLHNVNPVLGLAGYHFFDLEVRGLAGVLLLTKRGNVVKGSKIRAVRLSDFLWLEIPEKQSEPKGQADGESARG